MQIMIYHPFTRKKGTLMKQIMWGIALAISLVGWRGLSAQSKSPRVMAEITGASLKWILAAEPKFQREKLDLDKYVVSVVEQGDSIIVELRSFDSVKGARGSTGSYPGYELEIRKKDVKVVRSNYIR
jgi:hypothetical protein